MATMVDDFNSGPLNINLSSGVNDQNQTGTMLGGTRRTYLQVAANPLNQSAHLDNQQGFLNLSTGVDQYLVLSVQYGPHVDTVNGGFISLGNLHSMGNAFRLNYNSSDRLNINFNIVVVTPGPVVYHQASENIGIDPNYSGVPGTRHSREFLFSSFGPGLAATDFSNVSGIWLLFQTHADFSIDSFEIV